MRVLITTPTGKVGRELVPLLRRRDVTLRLGARSLDRARAAFPGLEAVSLDLSAPATFTPALAGVDAVYLAWPEEADTAPVPDLLDAARRGGVRAIVLLSVLAAGRVRLPLGRVEDQVRAAGLPFTFLRPSWFMQNFTTSMAGAIRAGTLSEPAGEARAAFIDARDIAAVAAEALTRPGHDGRTYELTGPDLLSHAQVVDVIGREMGRPIRYQAISDARFREALHGLPPPFVELLSELFEDFRAGAFEATTDTVEQLLGRAPTRFARFVQEHRSVWT